MLGNNKFKQALRYLRRGLVGLGLLLLATPATAQVVISQVYASGGSSTSTYSHDFVELFNRGSAPVNISGWAIGYKQDSSSFWSSTTLVGSIPPGGYYLVQLSGSSVFGTYTLPLADAVGFTDIGSSGTVALFGLDDLPRDLVGFGILPPFYEGTQIFSTIGGGDDAILRRGGGCQDLDDNLLDFLTDSPFAFNSTWPLNPCGAPPVPSCSYSISPTSVIGSAAGGEGTLAVSTQLGCGWTAVSNAPFVLISAGASATGPGTVSYQVSVNSTSSARSGTLTVAGHTFTITQAGAITDVAPPFGTIDTPVNGSAGIAGSVAVTGWALDDGGVMAVRVLRDPVAPEAPGAQVFVGNAVLVNGARPDVAAAYSSYPNSTRAGWGYLMLTNMLPNRGDGTFTFYVYADDASGHSTLLGSTTISCANSTSTNPFGAIDTPAQGETVTGVVNNFGWVLSPGMRRADPPSGGLVNVFIDGVPAGVPGGWTNRGDLTALFPEAEYSGIGSALAVFTFNSATLTNGVHTIAWGVTDNQGGSAGIGSRYFTVSNPTALASTRVASPAQRVGPAPNAPVHTPLFGRRGFDLDGPIETFSPDQDGTVRVQVEELGRIELRTGATSAFMSTPSGPAALPIGSHLQSDGTFTWQPGVGFVGAYNLVFQTTAGQHRVQIVLNPKGTLHRGPKIVIDAPKADQNVTPSFTIAGWAGDADSQNSTGIDLIHIWAYPATGAPAIFLGHATMGGIRPDVAVAYGEQLRPSGYGLLVNELAPGTYDLAVFGWSSAKGGFLPAQTVRVTVR